MSKPITNFIEKYFLHFNAAALVDAAKGYEAQLNKGSKMLVSLAGAMSTAELGKIFAEMIRQDKVQIVSCTGANLEEDVMNLVAHSHYKRVPNYRDLTPQDEWDLLEKGLNRVTDTCIPEEEAFRRIQEHIVKIWKDAEANGERYLPVLLSESISDYYFKKAQQQKKEVIKATRITGVDNLELGQFTGDMYQNVNIYDDYVELFNKEFLSPIADEGKLFYKYYLMEKDTIDGDTYYHLKFGP